MKLAVNKRSARRIIESESSSSDSDSGDETISDSSSINDVPNSDGPADLSVTDATDGTDVLNSPLRLRDGPANRNAWMTEGGFHLVKSKDRVVVNSNYNVSRGVPRIWQGGGAKNFFFQIWEFACREAMRFARGVRGHAPPRNFF